MTERLGPERAVMLATTRPRPPGAPLREIDRLRLRDGVRVLALGPMPVPLLQQELCRRTGRPVDRSVALAVRDVTDGRPRFLHELLSILAQRQVVPPGHPAAGHPALDATSLGEVVLPRLAHEVVARLDRLTIAATDLVQALAVLGDGTDLPLVRQLAGIDRRAAERGIDAAVGAELLAPSLPLRFSFPLLRAAVYHEVSAGHRSRLHAQAAALLAQRGAETRSVCDHLMRTDAADDHDRAAALHHAARVATAEDEEWTRRCLERALREPPAPDRVADVLLDLAAAEARSAPLQALSRLLQAMRLGAADPVTLAGLAATVLRRVPARTVRDRDVLAQLRTFLSDLPPSADATRLDLLLALGHAEGCTTLGDLAAVRSLTDRVSAMPPAAPAPVRFAPPAVRRQVRALLALERLRAGPPPAACAIADELVATLDPAEIGGTDLAASELQLASVVGLLCCGRFGAEAVLRAVAVSATAAGDARTGARVEAVLALSALWQGALDEAVIRADEVTAHLRAVPGDRDGWADHMASACRAAALLDKGDVVGAMVAAPDPLPMRAGSRLPLVADAVAQLLAGDTRARCELALGQAIEATESAAAVEGLAKAMGAGGSALTQWRVVAAAAAKSAGRRRLAEAAAAAAVAEARQFGEPRTLGAALRASAGVRGLSEGLPLLLESRRVLKESAARLEQARTDLELGRALLAAGQLDDGRGVLRRAAHLASLCGADALLELAADHLRASGCRPRRVAMTGWEALTPAEARVTAMAADGATNAAIAAALVLSAKTVEGHLANAYRKLGIASRRELPAAAGEPGRQRGADGESARVG